MIAPTELHRGMIKKSLNLFRINFGTRRVRTTICHWAENWAALRAGWWRNLACYSVYFAISHVKPNIWREFVPEPVMPKAGINFCSEFSQHPTPSSQIPLHLQSWQRHRYEL
jgi:hypothetical protein